MTNAVEETKKRLELAQHQLAKFQDISLGITLVGSVAYSPNVNVTETSDLDMLVVVENLKDSLPQVIEDETEAKALQKRFFEGYCIKKTENGVPISIHVLSKDAFEIISRCFVANIRVYRPDDKCGCYQLLGFERKPYEYSIKNIKLPDLKGVRTIVPVSFIAKDSQGIDHYFLGIHRDKLLSRPGILHDPAGFIGQNIDKLWHNVVENLYDEARRLYDCLDLNQMSVLNALSKKDKMCPEAKQDVEDKTRFYLKRIIR
jgi:predicted nucleotidyltransferase